MPEDYSFKESWYDLLGTVSNPVSFNLGNFRTRAGGNKAQADPVEEESKDPEV